nr:carboxymuconolactone decarboxylase family protein [Chthoniobacterales bacterium]
LIAAYVSGLNGCNYCHAVHTQTAVKLGIDANVIPQLLASAHDEHVDVRMQSVLAFVRKLTLSPASVTGADADAVFATGWDDRALHDAAAICALFNLMNRLVNGLGVEASEAYTKLAAQRLAQNGYAQLLDLLPPSK